LDDVASVVLEECQPSAPKLLRSRIPAGALIQQQLDTFKTLSVSLRRVQGRNINAIGRAFHQYLQRSGRATRRVVEAIRRDGVQDGLEQLRILVTG
jgi:hypothetical protein